MQFAPVTLDSQDKQLLEVIQNLQFTISFVHCGKILTRG